VNLREWSDKKTGASGSFYEVNVVFHTLNGREMVVRRKSPVQTKRGAEQYERQVRQALLDGTFEQAGEEVPTFEKWFNGRFWTEWVVAQRNKPSEQEAKRCIYKCHLKDRFGHLRLDEIAEGNHIAQFKAKLVERVDAGTLSLKSVNNILAVLSKALRYAEDAHVIALAPRVRLYNLERPEIESWELEEYARILAAAKEEGPEWYAAACLAGEAGLRIGEVRALRWERGVDLVAGTLTVTEQTRKGVTGSPKGRTRRTVPMTATLLDAIQAQPAKLIDAVKAKKVSRRGYVVHNPDGSPIRDGQTMHSIYRICRSAGLPERGWHCLRHSFGTHAALFGVNPWRLQAWMGHKRIDETMRYVHVADDHGRPLPEGLLEAASHETNPDRRIVRMLSARRAIAEHGAENATPAEETQVLDMRKPSVLH